jgi:hypothetical protein
MKKLTTTLASALAVLLLASGAWAWETWDEELSDPDNGYYVFHSEEDMNVFLEEYTVDLETEKAEQEQGMLDICWAFPPECYFVATLKDEGEPEAEWHVTTAVEWSSYWGMYLVDESQTGSEMWTDVDALRAGWRHLPAVCEHCNTQSNRWDQDTAMPKHYVGGHAYYSDDDYCYQWALYQQYYNYWGTEYGDFDDKDYTANAYLARFEHIGATLQDMDVALDWDD